LRRRIWWPHRASRAANGRRTFVDRIGNGAKSASSSAPFTTACRYSCIAGIFVQRPRPGAGAIQLLNPIHAMAIAVDKIVTLIRTDRIMTLPPS